MKIKDRPSVIKNFGPRKNFFMYFYIPWGISKAVAHTEWSVLTRRSDHRGKVSVQNNCHEIVVFVLGLV
jgi:hypothetical protein